MLENEHMTIALAASGQDALEYAQQATADLVLMDIRMPGMDGVQTTQALRRMSNSWARCPIVAVTAHALGSERQQWLTEGLDDVLIKPVDEAQLQQLLQRFLGVAPPVQKTFIDAGASQTLSSAPDKLPVIDLVLGTRLAGGKAHLAREQLKRLIDSLPESQQQMRSAYEAQDLTTLLDWVHSLNGASRYCGAPELALLVESLETRLRTSGLHNAESLLNELYDAMARLQAQRVSLVNP